MLINCFYADILQLELPLCMISAAQCQTLTIVTKQYNVCTQNKDKMDVCSSDLCPSMDVCNLSNSHCAYQTQLSHTDYYLLPMCGMLNVG